MGFGFFRLDRSCRTLLLHLKDDRGGGVDTKARGSRSCILHGVHAAQPCARRPTFWAIVGQSEVSGRSCLEHPTRRSGGLKPNPSAFFRARRSHRNEHFSLFLGSLVIGSDRKVRSVRRRPSRLKLELHGIAAFGQDVTFGRGEGDAPHRQAEGSIRGWKVILTAVTPLASNHLVEQNGALCIVEDHATRTHALQHQIRGTLAWADFDVKGWKVVVAHLEPRVKVESVVKRASFGNLMFHDNGGGGAEREVVRACHDGIGSAWYGAPLLIDQAPPEARMVDVFSCVQGTSVVQLKAWRIPSAVVHDVSCGVRCPPICSACRGRVQHEVLGAVVVEADGRLNDVACPVDRFLCIKVKRHAKIVERGFGTHRCVDHGPLSTWRGQDELPVQIEVCGIRGDDRHHPNLPWRQGLGLLWAGGEGRPTGPHAMKRAPFLGPSKRF